MALLIILVENLKKKVKGASVAEVERTIVWMPSLEFKCRTNSSIGKYVFVRIQQQNFFSIMSLTLLRATR